MQAHWQRLRLVDRGGADQPSTAPSVLSSAISQTDPGRSATGEVAVVPVSYFDEYALVAKLGRGGMADVFLALSQGLNGFRKLLVIKRLHAHMNDDPQLVAMFMHEAKLAAGLHHPNIVQTNKVGAYQGQHFLAMEYLDGQPLNRVLRRLRGQATTLPATVAVRIVADALDGLHYAHNATDYEGHTLDLVHRDVSPHNVFVTYDGEVKLLDFGIAKVATAEECTRVGLIKGKFSYIAPEQARGETVDRRADVWSMGITLWECLAGERLFRGENEVALLRSTLTDNIPFLSDVAPHVPEELSLILEGALQRDRERRFPTALAFKEKLEAWLANQADLCSRRTIATLMHGVFVDKIEEQKDVLRACLARVAVSAEPRAELARPSVPPPVPRAPARASHFRNACLLAVVLAAGLLVTLALHRGATVRDAAVGTRPSAAPNTPAATLRAPAAAALPATPPVRAAASMPSGPALRGSTQPAANPPLPAANPPLPAATPLSRASGTAHPKRAAPADAAAPAAVALPEAAPETMKPGRLQLDSVPYAIVSLDGVRLGMTPIDIELPAAAHTLLLRNPEQDLETRYRVTIRAGESINRRVVLE